MKPQAWEEEWGRGRPALPLPGDKEVASQAVVATAPPLAATLVRPLG